MPLMRRNTSEFRIAIAALTASGLLSLASPSRATPRADVSVDCPELTAEARSSLEARAGAEIALKDLRAGHVQIECGAGRVRVAFQTASGQVLERALGLGGEPATWVEPILALVHELISSASETPRPNVDEFPTEA